MIFEGKFVKILPDPHKKSRRICLFQNIKLEGSDEILTNHLYLRQTGELRSQMPGRILIFKGIVCTYKKQYEGNKFFKIDYEIRAISEVKEKI